MNPRDFCREPGYPIALLTTYSFDPSFFERLVLPDLWAGGSKSVLVFVDHGELRTALNSHTGHLRHIGRRYFLQPVELPGAFHAKVFLRLGDEGCLAWVGSNNLTRGGWGSNTELASAWQLERDRPNHRCGWLPGFLTYLKSNTAGLANELLDKTQRMQWLVGMPRSEGTHDVLISHREALWLQLRDRWAGRRFTSLKVLTGSTDRDAGFLRRLTETFALDRVDICVSPEHASFDVASLRGLRARVRIVPPPEHKLMHAKFYWFDGPDGSAAAWGSANCSRSAWLIPARNLEAMVVDDIPDPDDYSAVLRVFEKAPVDPSLVLATRPDAGKPIVPADSPLRIVAASVEPSGRMDVEVDPPIPAGTRVFLDVHGSRLRLAGEGRRWTGALSDHATESPPTTVRVVFEGPGSTTTWSDVGWVDHLAQLRDVLSGTDFRATASAMLHFKSHAADRRLAHELGRIGMAILTETSSYPDAAPSARLQYEKVGTNDDACVPLDPEALLVSLGDVDRFSDHRPQGISSDYHIGGVFRALFAQMAGDSSQADVMDDSDAEVSPSRVAQPSTVESQEPPMDVARKARDVLQRHMARFLHQLEAQEFADACTATQLAQAAGYAILVAAMGEQRSWCTDGQRHGWVTRSARALITDDRYSRREALLSVVGRRYEDSGRSREFDQAIGDGQLWLTLLCAWSMLPDASAEERLQQVTLWRDFVGRRELLGATERGRLDGLFRAYFAPDVIETARSRAERLGRRIRDIEGALERSYEDLKKAQASTRLSHRAGEVVWSPKGGWGITREDQEDDKVKVYVAMADDVRNFKASGWFVNVSRIGETAGASAELVASVEAFLRDIVKVDRAGPGEGDAGAKPGSLRGSAAAFSP